jgi:hypothetical protein
MNMTSFENLKNIDLFSLIKITSLSPLDEALDFCKINDLAIVIDKDYIKHRIKVRLLEFKQEVWLDTSTCFDPVIKL